jgi:hypothetical protein
VRRNLLILRSKTFLSDRLSGCPLFHAMLLLWVAGTAAQATSGAIWVQLERRAVSLGEPVLMQVRIDNRASVPLDLDLGGDGTENILISIVGPDGKTRHKPPTIRKDDIIFFGNVHLESGGSYAQTVVLNQWFQFEETGRYEIKIALQSPLRIAGKSIPAGDFVLPLEISPGNPSQLASACSQLVSRIHAEGSAQDSLSAALALSFVHDSIVVPYWAQVLERPGSAHDTAISSLANLGNSEAVAVLARNLQRPESNTSSRTRSALKAIATHTTEPSIKKQIDEALLRQ